MENIDSSPAKAAEPIDLSTTDAIFTASPRSVYVGVGGDIYVDARKRDGTIATNLAFMNFPDGQFLPVACITKVYRTTTTASELVALY